MEGFIYALLFLFCGISMLTKPEKMFIVNSKPDPVSMIRTQIGDFVVTIIGTVSMIIVVINTLSGAL